MTEVKEQGDVRLYGASRLRELAAGEGGIVRGLLFQAAHILDGGLVEADDFHDVPILKVIRDRIAGRLENDAPLTRESWAGLVQDLVDLIDVLRQAP